MEDKLYTHTCYDPSTGHDHYLDVSSRYDACEHCGWSANSHEGQVEILWHLYELLTED